MTRGYKVRSYVNGQSKEGREYKNYALTVPNEIAEALPKGMTFVPKMTEDGLLYQPRSAAEGQIELPDWAKAEQSGNGNSNSTETKKKGATK